MNRGAVGENKGWIPKNETPTQKACGDRTGETTWRSLTWKWARFFSEHKVTWPS